MLSRIENIQLTTQQNCFKKYYLKQNIFFKNNHSANAASCDSKIFWLHANILSSLVSTEHTTLYERYFSMKLPAVHYNLFYQGLFVSLAYSNNFFCMLF